MRILVVLLLVSLGLAALQSIVPGSVLNVPRHDMTLGLAAIITFLVALAFGAVHVRSAVAGCRAIAGTACVLFAILFTSARVPGTTGPTMDELILAAGAALLIFSVTASMLAIRDRGRPQVDAA